MEETITFEAEDGTDLVGSYYHGSGPSVILLHMLDHDRNTWNLFAEKLNKDNYTVLSIDLRGHGQSNKDWKTFDEEDFLDMIFDVQAAKDFLKKQGADTKRIIIMGASIGANLALEHAAEDEDVRATILLSPGLNYKGLETEGPAEEIETPVLIVASEGDEYSAKSSEKLDNLINNSKLKIYPGDRHGTDLFIGSDLNNIILEWLYSL